MINIIEEIVVILINLIGFWLAFWVYSADRKKRLNQWFAIMTFFVVLWVDFAFLGYKAREDFWAAIFYRLNWGSVALFLISAFYFYILYFLKEKSKHLILEKFILLIGILLAISSVFSSFIIEEVIIQPWGAEIIFGSGNILFNFYSFFVALLVILFLTKRYFYFPRKEKLKVQYFLIGTFLFVLFNIIFNIALPSATKTVAYQHFGDYSAIFLLGFTAYAIVKRELFDIKVVLTSIFVSLIAILLLFDIFFFTPDFLHQLFKILILTIFLYFGYFLIKSVLNEIKRREQLEKLTLKLEKVNVRLKKLLKMKEEFLHITSHQLRTPLTAIRGMVSMWCEGDFKKLPQTKKEEIKKRIYLSTERLNNITNDMIDAMELEGGGWLEQHNFKSIFLPQIIQETIETLKTNFDKKGLYIKFNYPKNLPKIQGAENYLRQVFMNLIDNAQKYTPKGGVNISLKKENNFLACEIADTGIGISQEDKERLFKKFSRGKRAEHFYTSGTGLGLFIVKKIIEEHQGKISVFSKGENKGTTFRVCLPMKK